MRPRALRRLTAVDYGHPLWGGLAYALVAAAGGASLAAGLRRAHLPYGPVGGWLIAGVGWLLVIVDRIISHVIMKRSLSDVLP